MYAVPTARCSALVSRVGLALPHTSSFAGDQSSLDGATETPGVHSVLKKLWSAPMIMREERSTLSSTE
jgi:hypothetical protein